MRGIDWLKETDSYKAIKTEFIKFKEFIKKNYIREDDSTKMKVQRIYKRLKIRVKGMLER